MLRRRILVLFAHPVLERSRVHRRLLGVAAEHPDVRVRDLYELYPEMDVDIRAEKAALGEAEVVVMQHPLYWYSVPAILKQWVDVVLEHGWAYGSGGTHLEGKWLLTATSAGGSEEAYRSDGINGASVRGLMSWLELTARLCGMRYLAPFVAHGVHRYDAADIERCAARYRRVLDVLCDPSADLQRLGAGALFDVDATGEAARAR